MLYNPRRKQLTSAFRMFLAKCSLSLFSSATLSAHCGIVGSVARQCIWGLWWTKWHYNGISPSTLAICCQLLWYLCSVFVYLPSGAAIRMKSEPILRALAYTPALCRSRILLRSWSFSHVSALPLPVVSLILSAAQKDVCTYVEGGSATCLFHTDWGI
jgi:hypothetical protein